MKKVFISYSRRDQEAVEQLVEDLRQVGIDVWHDQALSGGQKWWDNILSQIRECDVFIFALSPASENSEACNRELDYVVKLGRPILPVLVAPGINLNLLTAPLNEIHVADYQERDKEAALDLVRSIYTTPAPPALPDPLPPSPPVPVSYLSTLKERIDITGELTPKAQAALVNELEEKLEDAEHPAEVRELLQRLKRRDELLAKVAKRIDGLLGNGDVAKPEPDRLPPPRRLIEPEKKDGLVPPPGPQHCTRCSFTVTSAEKYCGKCGLLVPHYAGGGSGSGQKSRQYRCSPELLPRLTEDLKTWLNGENFETQQVATDAGGQLLQIKKRGGWREFLGMSTALNILLKLSGNTLTVEIGAGKWVDKAVVGAAGIILMAGLPLITAGYGAWEQANMPDRVFEFVGARLANK